MQLITQICSRVAGGNFRNTMPDDASIILIWFNGRTPESTPRCLIQNLSNFAIFIQTILANFYPKLAPRIRQTQFLSKFRIRPSKTSNFAFFFKFFSAFPCGPSLCLLQQRRRDSNLQKVCNLSNSLTRLTGTVFVI